MDQDLWWDKGTSEPVFLGDLPAKRMGFLPLVPSQIHQKPLDVAGKFSLISVYIWHVQRLLELIGRVSKSCGNITYNQWHTHLDTCGMCNRIERILTRPTDA